MRLFILTCLILFNLNAVGIEGQKAPSFGVDTWIQTNGRGYLDIADFKGQVVYLYGFQAWCPGCHSHGFPTLSKLSEHYKDDKKVAFVAVQTVFEGYFYNTISAAKKIIDKYKLTMPVGQSGLNHQRSQLMKNYKTGGTPWVIIIDKKGIVRFNAFGADTEYLVALIDMLKKEN